MTREIGNSSLEEIPGVAVVRPWLQLSGRVLWGLRAGSASVLTPRPRAETCLRG